MHTLNLTSDEFHAFRILIDLGVKAAGLGAVTPETLALRRMIETSQPVAEPEKEIEA